MRFHFTKNGDMHRGFEDECARCRNIVKKRARYRKSREGVVDGRTLNRKCPPLFCACGKKLEACKNTTGMCISCLRVKRSQDKQRRLAAIKERCGACTTCGKRLNPNNKTGLCKECFDEKGRGKRLWPDAHDAPHGKETPPTPILSPV